MLQECADTGALAAERGGNMEGAEEGWAQCIGLHHAWLSSRAALAYMVVLATETLRATCHREVQTDVKREVAGITCSAEWPEDAGQLCLL